MAGGNVMAYCPRCHYEYQEGTARCPDCGADLLPGALPKASAPTAASQPVRLCTVPDVSAGDILRAALAEHGIPSYLRRHGPITGELGRVTDGLTEDYAIVMVPANRLGEAQRVLAAIESGPVIWPEGMEPEE